MGLVTKYQVGHNLGLAEYLVAVFGMEVAEEVMAHVIVTTNIQVPDTIIVEEDENQMKTSRKREYYRCFILSFGIGTSRSG